MTALLLLPLGGALGALLRFWIARGWAKTSASLPLPFPTLLVNILGSALLGALFGAFSPDPTVPIDDPLLLFAGVGFCGAFTTFSSFAVETVTIWSDSPRKALLYVLLTLGGALTAFWISFSSLS